MRLTPFVLGATVALLGSCARPFDPASDVASLRVLAVRMDHPTPAQGSDVSIDLLVTDDSEFARRPDGTLRPIELVWLGGCFDPAGDAYDRCWPSLAPALAALQSGTPSPDVGHGPSYTLHIPDDVVARHGARQGQNAYGISYVFYAACAGTVVTQEPNLTTAMPLACLGADGAAVGADGFVFGYLPIYTYPGIDNHNPIVTGGTFDGIVRTQTPCKGDTDCTGGDACGPGLVCVPVVQHCTTRLVKDCPKHTIEPSVDPASAEPDQLASLTAHAPRSERVYVQYYGSQGVIDGAAKTVVDPTHGANADYSASWSAPNGPATARFWAIVRDNREGVTWWVQDVVVR